MKTRLEKLRKKLGVQWKDIALLLDISVPMLGCLRRGERNPSEKVLARLAAVESGDVVLQPTTRKQHEVLNTNKAREQVDSIKKLLGVQHDEEVMPKIYELVQWKLSEQDRIIKQQREIIKPGANNK